MWVVNTLNRENRFDLEKYIENIYKEYNEKIILTLESNLGFGETFVYLYELIRNLSMKNIPVFRGPIIIGDMILINEEAKKIENTSLEDKIWWLIYSNMISMENENILINGENIFINGCILKRGLWFEYKDTSEFK